MKRKFLLTLTAAMALALCACGNSAASDSTAADTPDTEAVDTEDIAEDDTEEADDIDDEYTDDEYVIKPDLAFDTFVLWLEFDNREFGDGDDYMESYINSEYGCTVYNQRYAVELTEDPDYEAALKDTACSLAQSLTGQEWTADDLVDFTWQEESLLTETITYPVYGATYQTGANEDTFTWKLILFYTDTDEYAFAVTAQADDYAAVSDDIDLTFDSLYLDMPYYDDDPFGETAKLHFDEDVFSQYGIDVQPYTVVTSSEIDDISYFTEDGSFFYYNECDYLGFDEDTLAEGFTDMALIDCGSAPETMELTEDPDLTAVVGYQAYQTTWTDGENEDARVYEAKCFISEDRAYMFIISVSADREEDYAAVKDAIFASLVLE